MPRKPLHLDHLYFNSKRAAKSYFRNILWKYHPNNILEAKDFHDVMTLLTHHPNAKEKIGCGVKKIIVGDSKYTDRCFHIVRNDDSIENFSFHKCIDGDHSSFRKFCSACRKAIEYDIYQYKKKFFEKYANEDWMIKCQATGKFLTFSQAHIDHREPLTFSVIVHFFIESLEINTDLIKYETSQEYGMRFSDKRLILKFKSYHKEHARLRVVDSRVNLGKSHLARIKTSKADGTLL